MSERLLFPEKFSPIDQAVLSQRQSDTELSIPEDDRGAGLGGSQLWCFLFRSSNSSASVRNFSEKLKTFNNVQPFVVNTLLVLCQNS